MTSETVEGCTPTDVTAHFHLEVKDLVVRTELLGTAHSASRDGYAMRFVFPADDLDFGMSDREPSGTSCFSGEITVNGERAARYVTVLRVSVDCELPFSAEDLDSGRVSSEVFSQADKLVRQAADAARSLVRDYEEILRADHGKFWLGRTGTAPSLTWLTEIRERATDRRVR